MQAAVVRGQAAALLQRLGLIQPQLHWQLRRRPLSRLEQQQHLLQVLMARATVGTRTGRHHRPQGVRCSYRTACEWWLAETPCSSEMLWSFVAFEALEDFKFSVAVNDFHRSL